MQLDPEIRQAIELHPSDDIAVVSRDVSRQLNKHIPVTLVVKVRGSMQRAANVTRAKTEASGTLDVKLGRIEKASTILENLFLDKTLPLNQRIEASKELRQWTKLGMDAAGIADPDTETLFVVEGDWLPFKAP